MYFALSYIYSFFLGYAYLVYMLVYMYPLSSIFLIGKLVPFSLESSLSSSNIGVAFPSKYKDTHDLSFDVWLVHTFI